MRFSTKKAFRQHYRLARKSQAQPVLSATALAEIANSPRFQSAEHVAFYLAVDGELNLKPLIELARAQHKQCYLPRVNFSDNTIAFYSYTEDSLLEVNRYGIQEPMRAQAQILSPDKLDCVLLPLVAIDRSGHRLGMGGGYYDRAFHFTLSNPRQTKPLLIGAGFECQWCDALPHDPWDLILDGYLTESKLHFFE